MNDAKVKFYRKSPVVAVCGIHLVEVEERNYGS
jgi:hypothetical protein